MSEEFRFMKAIRTNTAMIIGIAGASGSGKTFTALELASGLAGDRGKIAGIDTEGRRMLHYADLGRFQFDHLDLRPPFTPHRFLDAVKAAESAGYAVVVIDSFSDVWRGDGGMWSMHDADLAKMKNPNSMAAWARPKAEFKLFISWLRISRMHVIVCLRAQEKNLLVDRKVVSAGWQADCEKTTPYELTCSFMLTPENPGVPLPRQTWGKLQEQHRGFFPQGKPITRETGAKLAAWCAGGAAPPPPREPEPVAPITPRGSNGGAHATPVEPDYDPFDLGDHYDPDPVIASNGLPMDGYGEMQAQPEPEQAKPEKPEKPENGLNGASPYAELVQGLIKQVNGMGSHKQVQDARNMVDNIYPELGQNAPELYDQFLQATYAREDALDVGQIP